MRFKFAFILYVFLSSGVAYADSETVEEAIGKLIVLHDKKFSYSQGDNAFGVEELYQEFENIYQEQISHLELKDKLSFFWASMWHLGFDGHSMYKFQTLIANDCGGEFIRRLELYINREEQLQRDKSRLFLTKKVLEGLEKVILHQKQTKNNQ